MKRSPLAEKVHQYMIRHSLAGVGDTIALAISGGLDSVALLHVMLELQPQWHWKMMVVHIDHGLRPESDPHESLFCRELAATYHLPYFEKKLELSDLAKKEHYRSIMRKNPGPESLARIARYRAFDALAKDMKCDAFFTAHHANDQAETVLYRMLTGSGIKGLSGIPEKRGIYRRPFKMVLRVELEEYMRKKELDYCEDLSNKNENYVRNKIRHTLIPALEKMGFKQVEVLLGRSAGSLREAEDALTYYTVRLAEEHISSDDDAVILNLKNFDLLPRYFQKALIKHVYDEELVVPRHMTGKQSEQILDFILRSCTGHVMTIMGTKMIKEREQIAWQKKENRDHSMVILCVEGEYPLNTESGKLRITLKSTPDSLRTEDRSTAFFSFGLYDKTLLCRPWKAGDRIRLFGQGKTKKISDLLKDEKIPAGKKKDQQVILRENIIIWVPGVKRAKEYIVGENEEQIVKIQYITEESK